MSYTELKQHIQRIADVNYAAATLAWDQETYMPQEAAEFKAGQLSTLSGISHELFTSSHTQRLIQQAKENKALSQEEQKNTLLIEEDFARQKKYSTEFVENMSKAISASFNAWQQARKESDFTIFAPYLEKLIELKKQECDILGYEAHPYNALLNLHEKKATVADLDELFADVRKELVPFVKKIQEAPQVNNHFFHQHFDKDAQWKFGIELLQQMGFDFNKGRQDVSSHPFTTSFSPNDVRVTTRINENDFAEMIWSCIHEGGHALYEQGLPAKQYGTPLGEAISLGIHESQSRLWENNVGRSLPYWKRHITLAKKYFPEQLKNTSALDFYKGANQVASSLIRTNADELTYHFHVMIRYEIEKQIFEGKLKVNELPDYWNTKYKEYLSIEVPNQAQGILQDVHWSHGSFGYFPTYSLGSFYAAQFFAQAQKENPSLLQEIEEGNTASLLKWLREKIHQHGKYYTAQELCIKITGEKLNFAHFMAYARKKFGTIYDLK
ncbi:MAG: carboxypeptidase M32 [Bacteroidetes bacterium]|nr:carboxypeptidase M32 [Bacteroidota bacterium]